VSNFNAKVVFPSPVGPIEFKRGWASVDVKTRHRTFRFATTHLEPTVPAIRPAQASELIQGVGDALPVILVGDFNADASNASDPTYASFRNANFEDAWLLRRYREPGFTCCQDADLLNPKSLLSQRLDWVLLRGRFRGDSYVVDAKLVGKKRSERTPSGLCRRIMLASS
jgi:endonuclease/exonuclease/phosphatase family metal-dependent hydrolase